MQQKKWPWVVAICLVLFMGAGLAISSSRMGRSVWRQVDANLLVGGGPADITHPRRFSRYGYVVSYPGNWRIVENEVTDRMVTIVAPGQDSMILVFVPQAQHDRLLEAMLRPQTKLFLDPARTTFTSLGAHEGRGHELAGRTYIGKSRLRSFSANRPDPSFAVVEIRHDKNTADNDPGFAFIESNVQALQAP